ncbi:MAG: RnfABCDGE type electron transport complex subunit G [Proteiniphilum sp.]|nr:RnfABCDGE type electron transport complex subunit G [Proteiniphilum sp.]NCD14474.1 RnfABCDGE type electron transport complex subunit G [Bacteroidia bacterium]MDD2727277.1 RnfABCDGE type electron transport complex subunit G [Proteiniphilum sp.]MDD3332047.1 RnfABCDGE type electron transport complex subunit G [Proteiniphilum sp.]MDD3556291.1 RnfABCDGE type electron transport complex subunit G [Proteiniphilum sp.]
MAKLQSSFRNMFLSLSLICLTVALLLAQVNKMTATPIAEAKAMKLQNAIREVVPAFDNDPVAEAYRMAGGSGDSLLVYPARQGDELVGFAINSYSNNGFSGNIQIMVGFDMEHHIVNYAVLQHGETPGLGSKMTEWFRDATRPSQSVIGRDLSQGALTVTKDGGDVDAITASTITSRAFMEAVNRAYTVYSGSMEDAWSGATTATDEETEETTNEGGIGNE